MDSNFLPYFYFYLKLNNKSFVQKIYEMPNIFISFGTSFTKNLVLRIRIVDCDFFVVFFPFGSVSGLWFYKALDPDYDPQNLPESHSLL